MSDTLLTQDEIDALLAGASAGGSSSDNSGSDGGDSGSPFTPEETEALKEFFVLLANGAASVLLTLSNDENAKCDFADLNVTDLNSVSSELEGSSVMQMNFNEGFTFDSNVFIDSDFIKSIASMMLGGAEIADLGPEYLSAAEAFFDQILGSVVMLWKNRYDIAARYIPPKINENAEIGSLNIPEDILHIAFDLAISEDQKSKLYILFSVEQAKALLPSIMATASNAQPIVEQEVTEESSGELSQDEIDAMLSGATDDTPSMEEPEVDEYEDEDEDEYEEEYEEPAPRIKKKKRKPGARPKKRVKSYDNDSVSSVEFADLYEEDLVDLPSNIDLLLDVPLQITVELGRTRMLVKDILELGTGSVIELERLAGESIDVLVNGKLIAKGEVVVIDENFGIRITSIVSPNERIAKLK